MRKTKTNLDNEVNVEIAKQEYNLYQEDLKKRQEEYIDSLNKNIKVYARKGYKSFCTNDNNRDFMTTEFMDYLKSYYEARGFKVIEEGSKTGLMSWWLRISWID